jgi:hypothetical protein
LSDTFEDYRNYNPLTQAYCVFNRNAIGNSRPTTGGTRPNTGDSTRTKVETYIIGTKSASRPVSAASIRLLRPINPETQMEKILQGPLTYSKVKGGHIEIQEDFKTKYPPRKFPMINTMDPLNQYDGVLMEHDRPSTKTVTWSKSRPPSGKSYKWHERGDF